MSRAPDLAGMEQEIDQRAMEATVLALVAGGLLIAASVTGVGGGVPLVIVLAVLAAALVAARHQLPQPGWVLGRNVDRCIRDVWVAPAVAALATVAVFGASPGEVQTVGGVIGFAGMVNYFLRPVYHLGYSLATSVARKVT